MDPHTKQITNFFEGYEYENGEWEDNSGNVVGSGSTGAHIYCTENEAKLYLIHNTHPNAANDAGQALGFFKYDLMKNGELQHTYNNTMAYKAFANGYRGTLTDYAIVGTSHGIWVCNLRIDNVYQDPSLSFYSNDGMVTYFEDPAFIQQLVDLENALMNGKIDFIQYQEALDNMVDPNRGIKLIVELILMVGYFIILPIFWKKQTVGRLACKIKVVKENGEKAKPINFILREGFGQTIFVSVFTIMSVLTSNDYLTKLDKVTSTIFGFILVVGFFTMLGSKKTTLYDRISKTIVVLDTPTSEPDELDIQIKKENTISDEDIIDL
jgi:uncharacterized RDD family membrane protein YckC